MAGVVAVLAGSAAALPGERELLVTLAAFAAAVLAVAVLWEVQSRRGSVGLELALELGPTGVRYETQRQSGHLTWEGVEVRNAGDLLVLERGARPVLVVPARDLSASDLMAIATWAGQDRRAATGSGSTDRDTVTELPDGQLVVTGRLSPRRARAIVSGTIRRSVWIGLDLFVAVCLVGAWAAALPEIRAGQGVPVDVLLISGIAVLVGVIELLLRLTSARLAAKVEAQGGFHWRFSPAGVTTVSTTGEQFTHWSLGKDYLVYGDMLVARLARSGTAVGYLIGPLSPEQRRRLLRWVETGSGKRVAGPR